MLGLCNRAVSEKWCLSIGQTDHGWRECAYIEAKMNLGGTIESPYSLEKWVVRGVQGYVVSEKKKYKRIRLSSEMKYMRGGVEIRTTTNERMLLIMKSRKSCLSVERCGNRYNLPNQTNPPPQIVKSTHHPLVHDFLFLLS